MGLVYLPEVELGSLSSRKSSPDTEQSDMSNGTSSVNDSSKPESKTDGSTMPQYGMTLEHSTENVGLDEWILSLEDSPVNLSLSLAKGKPNLTNGICGLTHSDSLARYDHDTHCWRTSQACLLTNTYDEYSVTWPRSGTIVNGMLWERPTWVQTTEENDSGYWPTPDCSDRRSAKSKQQGLSNVVKMFPTPSAADNRDRGGMDTPAIQRRIAKGKQLGLTMVVGGQLNPRWVEWLMGWPDGWTDLNASEMGGSLTSWRKSLPLERGTE